MSATADRLILVAENDSSDERLLKWAITNAGIPAPVFFVHDGAEAMDYLLGIPPYHDRAKYPFPRLLIVNLKMPRVDGFELLSWLQKLPGLDKLAVAVMSGPSWQQDFERARALGANLYLNKWLDFSELVQAIKALPTDDGSRPAKRSSRGEARGRKMDQNKVF
jgi:CheY-like chemotaxis protein